MISIFNEKGGVSKTTATHNAGFQLAELGLKVLIIDGDPQGSLSANINPSHSENFEEARNLEPL